MTLAKGSGTCRHKFTSHGAELTHFDSKDFKIKAGQTLLLEYNLAVSSPLPRMRANLFCKGEEEMILDFKTAQISSKKIAHSETKVLKESLLIK